MKLADVLRQECVLVDASFEDKAMVLCEIAALAKRSKYCRHLSEEEILEAIQEREIAGSTVIGSGIAIPHCRIKGIDDFVVGLISVPRGVDFDAPDRKKIFLIVFIIAPAGQGDAQIRLLSSISQTFQDPAVVKKIIAAKTPKALISRFLQDDRETPVARQDGGKNLMTVIVQDDPVFQQILASLAAVENISLAVFDAHNCREFLSDDPQFAVAAAGGIQNFAKMIRIVVENKLTNEMIRRIETITGSLSQCAGILVTVQHIDLAMGMLEL